MDIKGLILKNKKIALCLAISIGLGFVGGRGEMSMAEYKSSVEIKEQLDVQIASLDNQLIEKQREVDDLQAKKDEVDRLAKVEVEKKAKEEAEKKAKEEAERIAQEEVERIAQEEQNTNNFVSSGSGGNETSIETPVGEMVWLSATGSKYHSINNCGRMNPDNARQVTYDNAISQGYEACSKCY